LSRAFWRRGTLQRSDLSALRIVARAGLKQNEEEFQETVADTA
jgi:hypothetical protein